MNTLDTVKRLMHDIKGCPDDLPDDAEWVRDLGFDSLDWAEFAILAGQEFSLAADDLSDRILDLVAKKALFTKLFLLTPRTLAETIDEIRGN